MTQSTSRGDLGFTFRKLSSGDVLISHHGKVATTLRDATAADFLVKVETLDLNQQQQLMARLTGNYKHGNGRTAKQHPRQQ